jgi:hypothetical protein
MADVAAAHGSILWLVSLLLFAVTLDFLCREERMAQWKVNFDDLDLGERIGKGNFGEVYKGTYLGTDVAIKKLFFVDDDFMQKYIEREMDTLT